MSCKFGKICIFWHFLHFFCAYFLHILGILPAYIYLHVLPISCIFCAYFLYIHVIFLINVIFVIYPAYLLSSCMISPCMFHAYLTYFYIFSCIYSAYLLHFCVIFLAYFLLIMCIFHANFMLDFISPTIYDDNCFHLRVSRTLSVPKCWHLLPLSALGLESRMASRYGRGLCQCPQEQVQASSEFR